MEHNRRVCELLRTYSILLLSLLVNCNKSSASSSLVAAGPVLHVFIKYPFWTSSHYLHEEYPSDDVHMSSLSYDNRYHEFLIHYYTQPAHSEVYVAFQCALSRKWLHHRGRLTRRFTTPKLLVRPASLIDVQDKRLFQCLSAVSCDFDGGVFHIPDTMLYLNGDIMNSQRLVIYDKRNYLAFLPKKSYELSKAKPYQHYLYNRKISKRLRRPD